MDGPRETLDRQRILRPQRHRLRQAISAIREVATGREAWSALVAGGLLDGEWAADPRRAFASGLTMTCATCRGRGVVGGFHGWDNEWEEDSWTCADCDQTGQVLAPAAPEPFPANPYVAVVFACDPDGVARAEELAWRVVERLAPWGARAPARLVWRVGGPLRSHQPVSMVSPALEPLRVWLFQVWDEVIGRETTGAIEEAVSALGRTGFFRRAGWHLKLEAMWRAAVERGCAIPPEHPLAEWSLGRLESPFEPLLEIWRLGYALDEINDEAVTLIAPSLEASA